MSNRRGEAKFIDKYTEINRKKEVLPIIKLARKDCHDFDLSVSKYKRKSLFFQHLTPLSASQSTQISGYALENYSTVSNRSVISSPSRFNPESANSSPVRSKIIAAVEVDEIVMSKDNEKRQKMQREKYRSVQQKKMGHEKSDSTISQSLQGKFLIKLKQQSLFQRVQQNLKRYQSSYQRHQHRNILAHPGSEGDLLELHYQLKKRLQRKMLDRMDIQENIKFKKMLSLHANDQNFPNLI